MDMNKLLKTTAIVGILLMGISVAYYFIYRPTQKQKIMKRCNEEIENLVGWDSRNKLKMDKFKEEYERCLRQKGL